MHRDIWILHWFTQSSTKLSPMRFIVSMTQSVQKYDQMKTHYWNNLKLGAVVILDTVSKPVDFGFKGSRIRGMGSSF